MAVLWFHVPFSGSILALYFGLFCFLLSTVGIGLSRSKLVPLNHPSWPKNKNLPDKENVSDLSPV